MSKQYLPTKAVCERYQITPMSLWRWEHDPKVAFPEGKRFGTARKHYDLEEIEAWERRRAAEFALVRLGLDSRDARAEVGRLERAIRREMAQLGQRRPA